MKEMKKYLEGRIKKLEQMQDMFLQIMEESNEKGIYRQKYFETLSAKVELQEALIKLYSIEQGE